MTPPAADPLLDSARADGRPGGEARALADLIADSRRVLLFTGAGASTESGIPDYRTPGGVWSRYPNVKYSELLTSIEAREAFWARGRELYPPLLRAWPNAVHRLGVALEAQWRLAGVATQNVDGLHTAAGLAPERVVELHGNAHVVECLGCGWECERVDVQRRLEAGERAPECPRCGGILKSKTVMFGQPVPPEALTRARALAEECDLCLVIGSALQVYPAAYVPHWARRAGARLAILNAERTRLDNLCVVVVHGLAAETISALGLDLAHDEAALAAGA